MWAIDFGVNMPLEEAALYEKPFKYVREHVKPIREGVRREQYREVWWVFGEPGARLRRALTPLDRYIATPTVAKHRLLAWIEQPTIPDHQLTVFARDDDYFFGVLHSRAHELWALRMETSLEDRPRYTPTSTFATCPLPCRPGVARGAAARSRWRSYPWEGRLSPAGRRPRTCLRATSRGRVPGSTQRPWVFVGPPLGPERVVAPIAVFSGERRRARRCPPEGDGRASRCRSAG